MTGPPVRLATSARPDAAIGGAIEAEPSSDGREAARVRFDGEPVSAETRRRATLVPMATDKTGRTSAGILLYRRGARGLEVLLAHPGGPFHRTKDEGAWTIPKGEVEPGERLIDVARREFAEETGHAPPEAEPIDLGEIRQRSGKRVVGWALAGDLDPATAVSNSFEMEWPPRSGLRAAFPEIDRVAWFDPVEARLRIKPAQAPFLDRLEVALGGPAGAAPRRTGGPAGGGRPAGTGGPAGAGGDDPPHRGLTGWTCRAGATAPWVPVSQPGARGGGRSRRRPSPAGAGPCPARRPACRAPGGGGRRCR